MNAIENAKNLLTNTQTVAGVAWLKNPLSPKATALLLELFAVHKAVHRISRTGADVNEALNAIEATARHLHANLGNQVLERTTQTRAIIAAR